MMPCNCDYMHDYEEPHWMTGLKQRAQKADKLCRLLCFACTLLGDKIQEQPELCAWWDEHKHEDAARIKEERRKADEARKQDRHEEHMAAIRERLVHQLTDEEKEAIGFKDGGR